MDPLQVRCEARGIPVANLQSRHPDVLGHLLREVENLESSSIEDLRKEFRKDFFADAFVDEHGIDGSDITNQPEERARLIQTLKRNLVWKNSNLLVLRAACTKYTGHDLSTLGLKTRLDLLHMLAKATWEAAGIPSDKLRSYEVAHKLLDEVRCMEALSVEELVELSKARGIPRGWTANKVHLVAQLRRELVWRHMSVDQLRIECDMHRRSFLLPFCKNRKDILAALVYSTWDKVFQECGMLTCEQRPDKFACAVRMRLAQLERMPDDMLLKAHRSEFKALAAVLSYPKMKRAEIIQRLMNTFVWYHLNVPELVDECKGHGVLVESDRHTKKELVVLLFQQSCLQTWEKQGIPARRLGFKLSVEVVRALVDLKGRSLHELQEIFETYGMQAQRKMERRFYLTCLKQLAIEEASMWSAVRQEDTASGTLVKLPMLGKEWQMELMSHVCKARCLPVERLDNFQAALSLAMRHDKITQMSAKDLRLECRVLGLPTQGADGDDDLRRRLKIFALLQSLAWDELFQECMDRNISVLDVSWFSPRQEQEQRSRLARLCLRHDCLSEFEAKDFPAHRIGDLDALDLLVKRCELLHLMEKDELNNAFQQRGLPVGRDMHRCDMLAALRQCLIWECLPTEELERECWQHCALKMQPEARTELKLHLIVDMYDRARWLKNVPIKQLGSLHAAGQLSKKLNRLEDMDTQQLIGHYTSLGFPVVGKLPREQALHRLTNAAIWEALPEEQLLAECHLHGISVENSTAYDNSRWTHAEKLRDLLMLHMCKDDFEQCGIPAESAGSFEACARLLRSLDEVDAADDSTLEAWYTDYGLSSTCLAKDNIVNRLKTLACWMHGPPSHLQRACRSLGLNSIVMGPSDRVLKVRQLAQATWKASSLDGLFPEELPSGSPQDSDLQRLLAHHGLPHRDLPESAHSWGWWEWLLFRQSSGRFVPGAELAGRRSPEQEAACRSQDNGSCISVVVPTSSSRSTFHRQLWTVFDAQKWPNKELIVVETYVDEPSPFLAAKAAEDARVVHLTFQVGQESDMSIGLKRNICIYLAVGRYVANFDDDDIYAPRYLETMVGEMLAQKCHAITLRSWYMLECSTGKIGHFDPEKVVNESDASTLEQWTYGYGFSYVYSRPVALKVPYPNWSFDEDFEFMARLARSTQGKAAWFMDAGQPFKLAAIALLDDTMGLCLHLVHPNSTSDTWAYREVPVEERDALEVSHLAHLGIALNSELGGFQRTQTASRFISDGERVRYQAISVKSSLTTLHIHCPAGSLVRDVKPLILEKAAKACPHQILNVDIYHSCGRSGVQDGLPLRDDERVSLRAEELRAVFLYFPEVAR